MYIPTPSNYIYVHICITIYLHWAHQIFATGAGKQSWRIWLIVLCESKQIYMDNIAPTNWSTANILKRCMRWFNIPSSFNIRRFLVAINCWSLRCCWSFAWWRCSNYIFIIDLTPGFNGLGKDNWKTRREIFKLCDLVRLILDILRHDAKVWLSIMHFKYWTANSWQNMPDTLCYHSDHILLPLFDRH